MARHRILHFVLWVAAGLPSPLIPTLYAASGAGCDVTLEDNVLTLGNQCIRRTYAWDGRRLQAIALTDVQTGRTLTLQDRRPDWALGTLTDKAVSGQWRQRVVDDALAGRHLRVEVTTAYDRIDVRRVFRIYPNCPAIGCDYYLRAHDADLPAFKPQDTVLQVLRLPGVHWHYRAVEFFDRTDRNNTLVQETTALAYLSATNLRGNLLWARNATGDTSVFMVKEAPCSYVQLHYPGYDYRVSTREVRAVGMGIQAADLTPGQWIRTYSVVVGVCGRSETAFLKALRTYQKQRRRHVPTRDDMIMMNTWRNAGKYDQSDPLALQRVPFDYAFAVTMMAQPLAWFEGSGLPEEAFSVAPVIKTYRRHQTSIHQGIILPLGAEPDGTTWTGFQSLVSDREGYLLVFREYNPQDQGALTLYDLAGKRIRCVHLCGQGEDFETEVDRQGTVTFTLPASHRFALYRYEVVECSWRHDMSHYSKAGLLLLGTLFASLSLLHTAAAQEIPLGSAQWIATDAAFASGGESPSLKMPGVHVSGTNYPHTVPNGPLPLFRKSFVLEDAAISRAQVAVCGLGQFELSINGAKVGDHFLDPPWSDYADTCYYVTFDVADLLKAGENVLGVMLGNGMYHVPGGRYAKFVGSFGPPKLILCLVSVQGDRERIITSDATWRTDEGPITFSCIYGGEDYDARREQPGWDRPGFDDSQWKPVQTVDGPGGRLRAAVSPPIKVIRHLKPVSITELKDGRYEVDLGENLSARPVITVRGQAGRQVTIETAERKGQPWQGHSYTYTLKGSTDPEVFTPRFTYFGFQYLYVSGAVWGDDVKTRKGLPALIDIGADFVSSCGPRIGTFACSNPLFNDINAMIDRSVASNLQHVLTDCPHREKLGWLEVAHLMGPSILLNYDMGGLFRKICRDTTDSQLANGLVPDIAPEYVRFQGGFFASPEWGSACVQLPWLIYRWYGDEQILREQYATMSRYTDYLAGTRSRTGLVKGGLGDWYDWTPQRGHVGASQLTPSELPATCMLYDNARILLQTATLQGKAAEARKWQNLMHDVRRDFLAAYYDPQTKTVATGSQCALGLGLYFDLVPEKDRATVLDHLVKAVRTNRYRQSTGEVSFRYLIMALARAGRSDIVYRMINRTDPPGYGCMLKQGLKTLSERWDRPGSSLNHCMFGHIQEWFQTYLLGIRQAPDSIGYRKVLIDPFMPDGLDWARGAYDSHNGRIDVAWARKGQTVEVTVKAEKPDTIVLPEREHVRCTISAL